MANKWINNWKRCVVKFCRNRVHRTWRTCRCPKHHSRQWKENHPLKYAFNKLRNRAKQRGKDFTLTFEQYKEFAIKTGYDKLKGKTALSLSINRKDNSKGYHIDNIEAVTLRENSRIQYAPIPQWMKDEIMNRPNL